MKKLDPATGIYEREWEELLFNWICKLALDPRRLATYWFTLGELEEL